MIINSESERDIIPNQVALSTYRIVSGVTTLCDVPKSAILAQTGSVGIRENKKIFGDLKSMCAIGGSSSIIHKFKGKE
jgi:triacylglycerol esterase/lipase EstA (alpha/beta hydrolase family)